MCPDARPAGAVFISGPGELPAANANASLNFTWVALLCSGPSRPVMQVRLLSFPTCIKEPNTKPVHSRGDWGPERHLPSLPLSFSCSPPLCHLWQHLLPLLLFPIMQWAGPLSCPPIFIVLANHCPPELFPRCTSNDQKALMELVSLKEWVGLYNIFNPQGETTINKIQIKTML